jgi:hypothetical protein
MTTRTAIGLVGLTLATLSPAVASADAGGTDRPMKGTISGIVTLTATTGSFEGGGTGQNSHLGSFTAHQKGSITPPTTPNGAYTGNSTWSIVAADGDTLTGTATLTVEGPPAGTHTTTQISTITGGTGRFADATGTFTTVYHVTPVSRDGATVVNRSDGTTTGLISY